MPVNNPVSLFTQPTLIKQNGTHTQTDRDLKAGGGYVAKKESFSGARRILREGNGDENDKNSLCVCIYGTVK